MDAGARPTSLGGELLRLATRSWGEEGRPLAVLVHGVTSSSRTWWRVGPWFAENGWYAVAVDLRGHGASPRMRGGEKLGDLAADVRETVADLPGSDGRVDVVLGHSLGALTALKLCEVYRDFARRLALEDPPGPGGGPTGFGGVAHDVEAGVARAREAPEATKRDLRAENPPWAEEDIVNDVASRRDCDSGPVADMVREGLRQDLAALIGSLEIPTLLVLASEQRGSALPEPGRAAAVKALRRGAVKTFETGHNVHRDDFEGYVRLLGDWLERPGE